jgi:long-subunit acyl-CoA synthetase (AMP-forming)
LVEDIGELKPTIFCAVPRVLDRIYGGTALNLKKDNCSTTQT